MKAHLPKEAPSSLVAYELEPGKVLFVMPLPQAPHVEGLSDAEREILALLLEGHHTATIARLRGRSPRTVANQVSSVFRKVGVGSRAELAAKLLATPVSSNDSG